MTNIKNKLKEISIPHLRELHVFANTLINSTDKHEDFEVARSHISNTQVFNLIEDIVKHSPSIDELINNLMELHLDIESELLRRFFMIDDHLLTLLHANLICYVVGGIKLDLPPEQDQLLTRIVGTGDRGEDIARDAIEKIASYWSLMKLTDAEVAAMDTKNETSSEPREIN